MKFEWLDSALVKAIANGDWVLIDNANFCSPSVLDRLNPLLERNGRLQINEKGIQVSSSEEDSSRLFEIEPHANFRLILSLNETFGELSRPMRNRGIEIYVPEIDLSADLEDALIILADLFPFSPRLADYTNLIKSELIGGNTTYTELFRVFKLTYDYWLVGHSSSSVEDSLRKALADDFTRRSTQLTSQQLATMFEPNRSFFADVSKLRELSLYRFLFNFPTFPILVDETNRQLSVGCPHLDIRTFAHHFLNSTKWCNLICEWFRNVPLADYSLVWAFTRSLVVKGLGKRSGSMSVDALFTYFNTINKFTLFEQFRLVNFLSNTKKSSYLQTCKAIR